MARRTRKSRPKSRPEEERAPDGKFAKGTTQGPGRGPKKGAPNAGRPPDEFKKAMRAIADRPETLQRLRKLTGLSHDVTDDIYLRALKEAADRGYGKAVQPVEHGGPDGGPIPIDDAAGLRDRLARELAGIAARRAKGETP